MVTTEIGVLTDLLNQVLSFTAEGARPQKTVVTELHLLHDLFTFLRKLWNGIEMFYPTPTCFSFTVVT